MHKASLGSATPTHSRISDLVAPDAPTDPRVVSTQASPGSNDSSLFPETTSGAAAVSAKALKINEIKKYLFSSSDYISRFSLLRRLDYPRTGKEETSLLLCAGSKSNSPLLAMHFFKQIGGNSSLEHLLERCHEHGLDIIMSIINISSWIPQNMVSVKTFIGKVITYNHCTPSNVQNQVLKQIIISYIPHESVNDIIQKIFKTNMLNEEEIAAAFNLLNHSKFPITTLNFSRMDLASINKLAGSVSQCFSGLKELDLSLTDVGDTEIDQITAVFSKLENLNLFRTMVSDSGVNGIVNNCQRLKVLNVSKTNVTNVGLSHIANTCRVLKTLNVSETKVTGSGLVGTASKLTELINLWVSGLGIDDIELNSMVIHYRKLIFLDLSSNNVTEVGATSIARNLRMLKILDLSKNKCAMNSGLASIACHLRMLEHLILDHTDIEDALLNIIATNFPALKTIRLSCTRVTSDGVKRLRVARPALVVFHRESDYLL